MLTSRQRATLTIGLLPLVAALVAGVGYGMTESERQAIDRDSQTATEVRQAADPSLTTEIYVTQLTLDTFLLSGDLDARTQYRDMASTVASSIDQVKLAAASQPSILTELASLSDTLTRWENTYAQPAIAAVAAGDTVALRGLAVTRFSEDQALAGSLDDLTAQADSYALSVSERADALERTQLIGAILALTIMLFTAFISVWFVRRFSQALDRTHDDIREDAERSEVLNRFTEITSFAADNASVARSILDALALLVDPDAAVTHVLNRSMDRAVPEATSGEPIAGVLPLHALAACPGVVRGTVYVVSDASRPLSVRCPVYPVSSGTLVCVPLTSGETVGATHLYWERPDAFPIGLSAMVAKVAEHAALAIGNRRLVAMLQGQATTDARTGLANSRSFDVALEAALASRTEDETLAVMMLDLDHFKDFNDRRGHPAGDEALRTFSNVLRAALREGDLAARYGGEEFAVLLPHADQTTALMIAERVRSRVEATLLALGPGIRDRITVSIGLAIAPQHGTERMPLMRLADEALYLAKESGRNTVRLHGASTATDEAPTAIPLTGAVAAAAS